MPCLSVRTQSLPAHPNPKVILAVVTNILKIVSTAGRCRRDDHVDRLTFLPLAATACGSTHLSTACYSCLPSHTIARCVSIRPLLCRPHPRRQDDLHLKCYQLLTNLLPLLLMGVGASLFSLKW